jgi:hypothetical protein
VHETTEPSPGRSRRQLFTAVTGGVAAAAVATALTAPGHAPGDDYGPSGAMFYPVDPKRVYDSRVPTFQPTGILPPNSERIIKVADGCNSYGEKIAMDMVPWGTRAVALTVTATGSTGPNFLSVAPGDAVDFASSTINFPGGFDIATGLIVKLSKERTIKVFSGDQGGSTHIVVDVTGYFA